MGASTSKNFRSRRAVATMFLLSLPPTLGFGALVIDIGMLQVSKSELQGAVDAAALSGVGHLDGTSAGMTRAVAAATMFAGANRVGGKPVVLTDTDIALGSYDMLTAQFVPSEDPVEVNAVRVDHEIVGLPTFFAGAAFGISALDVRAQSLARRGVSLPAGGVDCFLPFAVPDCMLDDVELYESYALRMASAGNDNTGWANPFGSVNASQIVDQINGQCAQGEVRIGDEVYLQNGQVTTAFSAIQGQIGASNTVWDADKWGPLPARMSGSTVSQADYGYVVEGPILVFESSTVGCGSALKFNGHEEITGFAWAVVYDIDDHGSDKNLRVKLDATWEYDVGTFSAADGESNIVVTTTSHLVR